MCRLVIPPGTPAPFEYCPPGHVKGDLTALSPPLPFPPPDLLMSDESGSVSTPRQLLASGEGADLIAAVHGAQLPFPLVAKPLRYAFILGNRWSRGGLGEAALSDGWLPSPH